MAIAKDARHVSRKSKAKTAVPTTQPRTSSQSEYRFDVPADFPVIGRWRGQPVAIAGADNANALANWLAFNEAPQASDDRLWESCVRKNPHAFTTFRAMELFDSSLDLPKGDVVFSSVESPKWIKDDPPGEILDRVTAVRNRYTAATIWLHEPVYRRSVADQPPILLTPQMLDDEASRARQAVWAIYRERRRRYRVEYHARRIGHWLQLRWQRHQRYLAVSRKALELRSSYLVNEERDEVYDYVVEARLLGLHDEADFMFMTAYGPVGMSEEALERADAFRRAESGAFWSRVLRSVRLVRQSQLEIGDFAIPALAFATVPITVLALNALIPSVVLIDPILTFTLPEDRGRHWFIGHWDWKLSPDGTKTLVCLSA